MSLITQCPACRTLFKVVADQLKISEGWVRCGQCREIFDAQAHMTTLAAAMPSAPTQTQPQTQTQTQPQTQHAQPPTQKRPRQDFSSSDWVNSVNPPSAPMSLGMSAEADLPELDDPPSMFPPDAADEANPFNGTSQAKATAQDAATAAKPSRAAQEDAKRSAMPGFMRQAQRARRKRSPSPSLWARAGLLLLCLVLLCVGVLQVAYHGRDRLAAAQPAALPWLKDLCSIAGCKVGPYRHIESVLVEASGFNKLRTDGKLDWYTVTVNLKNAGPLPVAVPHIELSLNDAQDQPLLRRVLSPADLGLQQSALAPSAETAGASTVQIDAGQLVGGARIVGYRVLAFYP